MIPRNQQPIYITLDVSHINFNLSFCNAHIKPQQHSINNYENAEIHEKSLKFADCSASRLASSKQKKNALFSTEFVFLFFNNWAVDFVKKTANTAQKMK